MSLDPLKCLPQKEIYHRIPEAGVSKTPLRFSLSTTLILYMRERSQDETLSVLLNHFLYTTFHVSLQVLLAWICVIEDQEWAQLTPLPGWRCSEWLTIEMWHSTTFLLRTQWLRRLTNRSPTYWVPLGSQVSTLQTKQQSLGNAMTMQLQGSCEGRGSRGCRGNME